MLTPAIIFIQFVYVKTTLAKLKSRFTTHYGMPISGGVQCGIGISFRIRNSSGTPMNFFIDTRVEKVYAALQMLRSGKRRQRPDQMLDDLCCAEKIAWRQVYYYLAAVVQMIKLDMAKPEEVFLAFLFAPDGTTLYQSLVDGSARKFLTASTAFIENKEP